MTYTSDLSLVNLVFTFKWVSRLPTQLVLLDSRVLAKQSLRGSVLIKQEGQGESLEGHHNSNLTGDHSLPVDTDKINLNTFLSC